MKIKFSDILADIEWRLYLAKFNLKRLSWKLKAIKIQGKDDNSWVEPTEALQYLIDHGVIKYSLDKQFFNMLDRISFLSEPTDEHQARTIFCGNALAETVNLRRCQIL